MLRLLSSRAWACAVLLLSMCFHAGAHAGVDAEVRRLAGKSGVVYAVGKDGRVLVDLRSARSFIPASTIKVFTCLLAAETLGLDWRFTTEFHLDGNILVVRGHGDPFLVSEEIVRIAARLAPLLRGRELEGIRIDDSFFDPDIRIPGVGGSTEPYDALNSATAVNFNTIFVTRKDGRIVSAEEQTPLTPLAERIARRRGVRGKTRLNLGSQPGEIPRYAAELIAAVLRRAGARIGSVFERGPAPAGAPLYVHESSRTMRDVCAEQLYHSNNYIANQVFLAIGTAAEGSPARLEKSVRVAERFIAARPGLAGLHVTEGSGISYRNRATAPALAHLLELFAPHRDLLRRKHGTPNKTGTLKATTSVIGYFDSAAHGTVRYVIALDGGRDRNRWQIVDALRKGL